MKLYDAVDVTVLPTDGDAYLGYVDAKPGYEAIINYDRIRQRFPGKPVFGLSTYRGRTGAILSSGFDVENYDWEPSDLPEALGRWYPLDVNRPIPIIYCNRSTWPAAASYVGSRKVDWLIADWTERDHMLPGAWGVQWSSGSYDTSTILDTGETHPMTTPAINPPITIIGHVVDSYNHSGGGSRVLTDAGYVYDFGCPHISPGGPHELSGDAGWVSGGRVAARFLNTSDSGYTIVDTAGEQYRFGQ